MCLCDKQCSHSHTNETAKTSRRKQEAAEQHLTTTGNKRFSTAYAQHDTAHSTISLLNFVWISRPHHECLGAEERKGGRHRKRREQEFCAFTRVTTDYIFAYFISKTKERKAKRK